jgi:hypothetical protein
MQKKSNEESSRIRTNLLLKCKYFVNNEEEERNNFKLEQKLKIETKLR